MSRAVGPVWRRVESWVAARGAVPVLAVLTVLLRLPGLTRPVRADEAGFTLVARAWAPTPDSVYGPFFVDRPPLLVATYGALDAVGGPVAVRLVGALGCGVLVLLAARAGRLAADRRGGAWAALVVAATCTNPLIDMVGVKGELLAAPWLMGSVVLALLAVRARRWRSVALAFAAGFAGSVPLGLKQNLAGALVFTGVLLLGSVLVRRIGPRRLVACALAALAGAAVPVLAQVLWAVEAGVHLDVLWYAVGGFRSDAAQVLAAQPSSAPQTRALVLLLVGLVAGLGLVVGGFVVHAVGEWADDPSLTAAVAAMLAVDTTTLVLSGSYWRDYLFALLPSAALATALLARRVGARRGAAMRGVAGFAAVSSALCLLGWAVMQVAGLQPYPESDTATALRDVAEPGDSMVVYGGRADVQLRADLPSPYAYLWSLPMRTLDPQREQLVALLRSPQRPTWLVEWVDFHAWDPVVGERVQQVVEQEYVLHGEGCAGHPVYLARGVERGALVPDCGGLDRLAK